MPILATIDSQSKNLSLTGQASAITGGITVSTGAALVARPTSAVPSTLLAHGVRNGDKTDVGLARYYYHIIQQSTAIYRL